MAQSVWWHDESKTILVMHFEGKWSWEEFYAARKTIHELMSTVSQRVHVIGDFMHAQGLPQGNLLLTTQTAIKGALPNSGLLVICSRSMFIEVMVNALQKTFSTSIGKRLRVTRSFEEAVALIYKEERKNMPQANPTD